MKFIVQNFRKFEQEQIRHAQTDTRTDETKRITKATFARGNNSDYS